MVVSKSLSSKINGKRFWSQKTSISRFVEVKREKVAEEKRKSETVPVINENGWILKTLIYCENSTLLFLETLQKEDKENADKSLKLPA